MEFNRGIADSRVPRISQWLKSTVSIGWLAGGMVTRPRNGEYRISNTELRMTK